MGDKLVWLTHTMTTTNLSVVGSGPICAPINIYGKNKTKINNILKMLYHPINHPTILQRILNKINKCI